MSCTQGSSGAVGSRKKTERNRRCWTQEEETTLITALKDLIVRGWKSDNGFRAGYLNKLEAAMKAKFPTTDLKALPHINSKLSSWKKSYNSLAGILSMSGVGWNLKGTYMLECEDDQWEQIIKADPNARLMRYKNWPYYDAWITIFGKDRATGENAEDIQEAWNELNGDEAPPPEGFPTADYEFSFENDIGEAGDMESYSLKDDQHSSKSSKKRKVPDDLQGVCELLSEINRDTNARLDTIASRMDYEFDMGKARQEISAQLKETPGMSRGDRYIILELVAFKRERLEIWKGMDRDARADYVEHLLANRDG